MVKKHVEFNTFLKKKHLAKAVNNKILTKLNNV